MVPKRKVKTLKIFVFKQLGKVVLRSATDAGRFTDMNQVKCFRCGQSGHSESNCRSSKAKAKALPKAKLKAGNKESPRKTLKERVVARVRKESSTRLVSRRRRRAGTEVGRRRTGGRRMVGGVWLGFRCVVDVIVCGIS